MLFFADVEDKQFIAENPQQPNLYEKVILNKTNKPIRPVVSCRFMFQKEVHKTVD